MREFLAIWGSVVLFMVIVAAAIGLCYLLQFAIAWFASTELAYLLNIVAAILILIVGLSLIIAFILWATE